MESTTPATKGKALKSFLILASAITVGVIAGAYLVKGIGSLTASMGTKTPAKV